MKCLNAILHFARISFGRNCIIGMSDDFLHILLITLLICSHSSPVTYK